MKIDVLTLFPDMVKASLGESIVARAAEAGLIELGCYQIRDYSENKQNKVDDTPYGGGPGMLMTCQPLAKCHRAAAENASRKGFGKPYTVLMSPRGKVLDADTAKRLAAEPYLVIVCGHYEGIDQRFIDAFCDEEISIGDYVLTGGELPAAVLIDTVSRFVPGVLGSPESGGDESFEKLLLEYPQYTKPAEFEGSVVPEVLLGGNHADIAAWRLKEAERITKERRPDLYAKYEKSAFCEKRIVYFDNSATTRQTPRVTEKVAETASKFYGNPSSLTRLGMLAEKELTNARETIAKTIGADKSEIIFTASGTEANNLALKGYLAANRHSGKKVIVSAVEHPSVLETARSLENAGYKVEYCPVDGRGVVDLKKLFELIDNDTAMISVMTVNSETGAIMPIKEIAAVKNSVDPKIVLHTDCVQGYGKLKINVKEAGCDMLTASAHKIHGPRGTGFLYVRRGLRLLPELAGGGQEGGLRSGTENLPAICGFAAAAEDAFRDIDASLEHVGKCRDLFKKLISEKYGDKVTFNSDDGASLPYILNVSFSPIRAEVLLHALESENVFVSVGSACSSKKKSRSHVLTAMNVPVKIIDGSVRFSFSRFTTEEEIMHGAEVLFRCVKELRKAVRG
ncbi:MAG: tRNA (guanosine(37)-N1)-methyltransferase TrmD [Clostridia bacterium]|nr:tRNA (guanosine(37)-N1)-methyltransferase TrmD [Clostridia bacterium]